MKILLINKFLYPNGGSETYMFRLGEELKRQGHEVEYFGMEHAGRCVSNNAGSYTKEMDFHNGKAISRLTYPVKTIYSVEARKKIRRVLDDFKPDVCHLNNFNYQLTPSIILEINKWKKETGRECRIVYTAHDYQLICPNHQLRNLVTGTNCEKCLGGHFFYCAKGRCIHGSRIRSLIGAAEAYIWNRARVYRYIAVIICPSRFMKEKLDSNPLFKDRTVMMQNFADIGHAVGDVGAVTFIREKTGLMLGKYVLYFGRYSKEKGMNTLVNVCKKHPYIPFIFAGKGRQAPASEGIHNIHDIGFQTGDMLKGIISNARFSVVPSEWSEPYGLSAAESISLGVPVIASNVGGLKEMIDESGAGLLYESGSAEDLGKAVRRLWEDDGLLESLKAGCREYRFMDVEGYCKRLTGEIYV